MAAEPAAYVVFDLLARNGKDLRDRPYWKRRRTDQLLGRSFPTGWCSPPPPPTPRSPVAGWSPTQARVWKAWSPSGSTRPTGPGLRGWQKLRTRITAEAVIGGVTGTVHAPQELILGRHDHAGRLRIAGRTTALRPSTAARLGALLEQQAHAWPERLPAHRWGAPRTPYTRVRPDLIVEVSADLALDGLRWRRPSRFVRLRADLHPDDLLTSSSLVSGL